jgi:hypothetical protein
MQRQQCLPDPDAPMMQMSLGMDGKVVVAQHRIFHEFLAVMFDLKYCSPFICAVPPFSGYLYTPGVGKVQGARS